MVKTVSDIDIFSVEPHNIHNAWPEISEFVQMGLDYAHNEMTADDVKGLMADGIVIPVIMSHDGEVLSVVTLEIVDKPNKRIMTLMTAGGTQLDDWLDEFMYTAQHIAEEQGVDSIYVNGRKGWEKILKRYGYDYAYTVLMRDIECH